MTRKSMLTTNIWVSSDTHFCHKKEFLYGPRGFSSPEEMNEAIIENWNKIVSPIDTVYLLGDVMLNNDVEGLSCLKRLNGFIHILPGNHDTLNRQKDYMMCRNVSSMINNYATVLKYKGWKFYLSHYPTLTGNWDADKPIKKRVINLCGHTHSEDRWIDWCKAPIYHCELDAHDCKPVLIDNIIEDIRRKEEENA